jgi:hypothetical protein
MIMVIMSLMPPLPGGKAQFSYGPLGSTSHHRDLLTLFLHLDANSDGEILRVEGTSQLLF